MIKKIANNFKRLLEFKPIGRNLSIYPDDIFLVSYPKSGNTWARLLIGNLIFLPEKVSFSNIERKIPDIYIHSNRNLLNIKRPRVIKSHEYFDPRYKKVIYIVRDPRDIILSYYHHHIKFHYFDERYPIENFMKDFMAGNLDSFGVWGEHVESWISTKEINNKFLLLKYEDMISDTHKELLKIISFLNINIQQNTIEQIINYCSIDNMKKLEEKQGNKWKPIKKTRKDYKFIRRGKFGEWKNNLSIQIVKEIENKWGKQMEKLAYIK